ncbi:unnamed protein product [Prunus brigantina]
MLMGITLDLSSIDCMKCLDVAKKELSEIFSKLGQRQKTRAQICAADTSKELDQCCPYLGKVSDNKNKFYLWNDQVDEPTPYK